VFNATPRPLFYRERNPVAFVWEVGWTHGQCGLVRKFSHPPGLDTRTVQPVASRYTGYALPAHMGRGYVT